MKRSEMIEHINEFLEKNGKPDYFGKRILAAQFLSFIESKGMQPPERLLPTDFNLIIKVHEWEDEE